MLAMEEKDVYETEDLPEADQIEINNFDRCVEKIDIEFKAAQDKFKDTKINADDADFSQRIKPYFNMGYLVETSEYVAYPGDDCSAETPIQKFQRLQGEFRDLNSDIADIKKISGMDVEAVKSGVDLFHQQREIEQYAEQMNRLEMLSLIGSKEAERIGVDDELCGFETKEVLEQLHKQISKHKKGSVSSTLSWQKFYQSPLTQELEAKKISDLDTRLLKLEAALGNSAKQQETTTTTSIVDLTKQLTARSQPLKGTANVDKLDARLAHLNTKLRDITSSRDKVTSADRQNKIAELFELVEKWKVHESDIKFVATRLEDLKKLHQQALQFPDVLSRIEKGQKDMKQEYLQYHKSLEQLTKTFHDSVQKTESSIQNMQNSMDKLK